MVVQEPVQAAIWQCLNHYSFTDATFLAERLYAEVGSDEALFLLATCYYRGGKPMQAYYLLKNNGCPTTQCKYLMGKCCLDINKLSEAEFSLCGNVLQKSKSLDEINTEYGETGPFALSLLATVYSKTERVSKAAESYKKSLKLNSFLWSSYEKLCLMGERVDPSKVFQTPTPQQINTLCNSPHPSSNTATSTSAIPASLLPNTNTTQQHHHHIHHQPPPTPQIEIHVQQDTPVTQTLNVLSNFPDNTPPVITQTPENIMDVVTTPDLVGYAPSAPKPLKATDKKVKRARGILTNPMKLFSPLSPSFGILPLENTPISNPSPGVAFITPPMPNVDFDNKMPIKKPMTRRQHQLTAHNRLPAPPVFTQSSNIVREPHYPNQGEGNCNNHHITRSSRLSASSSSVKENNNKAKVGLKAPTKKTRLKSTKSTKTDEMNELNKEKNENETKQLLSGSHFTQSVQCQVTNMQRQSAEGLMVLLQDIGRAYQCLSQYDCQRAIELFLQLPPQHYNTGWVLAQIGRAYFELNDHQKAEKIFQEVRTLEPYRLEGMEYYSTTLWHLQKDVCLSVLAHDLTEQDRLSPQTWCATGNCFSLQKEHDTAIKFLQRAVQVDPSFAYAYTLLGHEYVFTEELDKALSCFRNALKVDKRLYNAWYGIGVIYYKQEKFSLAEVHYRKALSINPHSSVLLCHIGVVQHALKKSDNALQTLNNALSLDPKNPLCKFHRASILFASDKYKESLEELNELKEIVPRESLVYFLIGKVHKKLGNTHLALMNFSWAMDLDPKGANNNIKEAIDKRYVTDDEETNPGIDSELDNDSSVMEADDVQLQAESDESL